MADKPLSLQDHFLNSIRRAKSPVTIFLVKGVKLQGVITWFDAFSLLLRRDGASQLVYKHSISTIMPGAMPEDFVATRSEGHAGHGREGAPERQVHLGHQPLVDEEEDVVQRQAGKAQPAPQQQPHAAGGVPAQQQHGARKAGEGAQGVDEGGHQSFLSLKA